MWYMFVVPFIIFFVVFLIIASSVFRIHKKAGDTMQNMINTVSAYAEKEISKSTEEHEKERICEYCGSTIANDATKCNACGAKVKNKK